MSTRPLRRTMRPVIQAEVTGCGIASVAAIAGVSYASAKKIANRFGIFARRQKSMVRNYSRTPTFEPLRISRQDRRAAVSILALASQSRSARDQMACRKE